MSSINLVQPENIIKVKKLSSFAHIPTRATMNSAGLDLYSAYTYNIPSKTKVLIKTDIAMSIPSPGFYGRIAIRSSIALKYSLSVEAGVIDADYRDNIHILVYNNGNKHVTIDAGCKIAQIIIEKIAIPEVVIVNELDKTSRKGGFGSSDK